MTVRIFHWLPSCLWQDSQPPHGWTEVVSCSSTRRSLTMPCKPIHWSKPPPISVGAMGSAPGTRALYCGMQFACRAATWFSIPCVAFACGYVCLYFSCVCSEQTNKVAAKTAPNHFSSQWSFLDGQPVAQRLPLMGVSHWGGVSSFPNLNWTGEDLANAPNSHGILWENSDRI